MRTTMGRTRLGWPKRGILTLSLFVSLAVTCGVAQSSDNESGLKKPLLPDGPPLRDAPNPGQWIVTITYADETARKQAAVATPATPPPMPDHLKLRPHMITTTRTDNLVHEVIEVIQGAEQEKWYVGKTQYWKNGTGPIWFVNQPGISGTSEEGYTILPATGFRDLAWVGEGTFVDTETYNGKPCLVFKSAGPAGHENQSQVAYVDLKTRWPVEVRVGDEIRIYQYGAPPDGKLVLPDDLKQQIAQGEKVRARLETRPPTAP